MSRDPRGYCLGKDRHGDRCRNHVLSETDRFCRLHQYMNDYTDDMIVQMKNCKGCHKYKYYEYDGVCPDCRQRSKNNRISQQVERINCHQFGCPNQASENGFCGKHETVARDIEQKNKGFRPCTGHGCHEYLPVESEFKKCEKCRENEREKDKNRRGFTSQLSSILSDDIVTKTDDVPYPTTNSGKKIVIEPHKAHRTSDDFYTYDGEIGEGRHCTQCGHFYEKNEFVGFGGKYVTRCFKICRSANQRADAKRDRSNRVQNVPPQVGKNILEKQIPVVNILDHPLQLETSVVKVLENNTPQVGKPVEKALQQIEKQSENRAMTPAERLRKWRLNNGITKNPHVLTPEEKREKDRLRKRKERAEKKTQP